MTYEATPNSHSLGPREDLHTKLIPVGIEPAVEESKPGHKKKRLRLDTPLIRPAGRRLGPSNEEIYSLIEFPWA